MTEEDRRNRVLALLSPEQAEILREVWSLTDTIFMEHRVLEIRMERVDQELDELLKLIKVLSPE